MRLVVAASLFMAALAAADGGLSAMVHMQIEAFIREHKCRQLFIEVGVAWYALSIWKLFFPERFVGADLLPVFDHTLGLPPRCDVCAIAVEANPVVHQHTLNPIEHMLVSAGVPALFIRAAASTSFGTSTFVGGGISGRVTGAQESFPGMRNWTVPAVDLAAIVLHAADNVKRTHRRSGPSQGSVLLKLDCEGAEYSLLPHLEHSGALCAVDQLLVEWHPMRPPSDRQAHLEFTAQFMGRHGGRGHSRGRVAPVAAGFRCVHGHRLRVGTVDDETYFNTTKRALSAYAKASQRPTQCNDATYM